MNGVIMERFIKPTVEQVKEEAEIKGYRDFDAEWFWSHHETRGWIPKGSTKQMKSWKAAMVTWEKMNKKFSKSQPTQVTTKKIRLFPLAGKNCKCGLPAVYKASGGQYDTYYCPDHMPEKIKERYE